MVRDRLSEFHTHSLEPSTVVEIEPTRVVYDTSSRLDQFRIHVDELRQSLDQLDNRIRNLQNRQTAVLAQSVVQPEEKAHLEALIQEIKDHVKSLKPRVRAIEADLKRDEANGSNQFRTSAEFRIRRDQCEMIKKKLNDLLQMFNHTQVEYKQRVSRRVKRQLEMAGEHLSTEEVDQMLDSNSSDIFYRQLNPLNFAVKLALEDATNRHNEILNLEQSIRELNEIFQDVFDMVRSQGELVDNIEKNITSATEYTSDARQNVEQAIIIKKSALRKKIICIILAVIVVLLLIIIVIILIGELVDNIEKNITSATEYTSEARQNVKQAVVYKKSALRKKIICIILAIIVVLLLIIIAIILITTLIPKKSS